MFGRKKKQTVEQGSDRRQVQRGGGGGPAFSYYSNRPDVTSESRSERTERFDTETGKSRRFPRFTSGLSFWLLMILAGVCFIKILALSTNPKVIVVGKSSISDAYQQSTDIYAVAAHKLLNSSLTNHSKLTIDLAGTAAALQKQFPELQTVTLDVPLVGSRPIVYVQLAQPTLVLQTSHGNYALNSAGILLAKLQRVPDNIPMLVDQSGATPKLGKQSLPSSTVSFLATVSYQFNAAHIAVSTYVLPSNSPYELDARPAGHNYPIRFNLQADALTQSGAAIATYTQVGDTPTSYIDVRTPDRVYYK